jgi:RHS repeat-associated protein
VKRIFDTLFMLDRLGSADEGETIGPLPPLGQMLDQLAAVEDTEGHLTYNRARHYDPTPGRWLSEDPLGCDADDGHLHPYPSPAAPSAGADENP